jgi:predicted component of type VI protein secretion system
MSEDRSGIQKRVLVQTVVEAGATAGGDAGSTLAVNWVFPGETIAFGRSEEDTQVTLAKDANMSKRHFEIAFDGTTCRLKDLNSANGTLVNGKRVTSTTLSHGDEICAGTTIFKIAFLGEDETTCDAEGSATPAAGKGTPLELDSNPVGPPAGSAEHVRRKPADSQLPRIVTLRLQAKSSAKDGVEGRSRLLAWIRAGQSITIGSSDVNADWQIVDDPRISPLHFQVSFDGETCILRSLDPKEKTQVNGEPATSVRLNDGDTNPSAVTSPAAIPIEPCKRPRSSYATPAMLPRSLIFGTPPAE